MVATCSPQGARGGVNTTAAWERDGMARGAEKGFPSRRSHGPGDHPSGGRAPPRLQPAHLPGPGVSALRPRAAQARD